MRKDIRLHHLIACIRHPAFLLFFWGSVGLILGTVIAAHADLYFVSWMRSAVLSRESIICLASAQLLPFLIAAYAVYISSFGILYATCSCRLFVFSYIGSLVGIAFGSAGWLVKLLFLFIDVTVVPCLCWFCFQRTVLRGASFKRDLWISIGISIAAVLLDYLLISPFLVRIIDI